MLDKDLLEKISNVLGDVERLMKISKAVTIALARVGSMPTLLALTRKAMERNLDYNIAFAAMFVCFVKDVPPKGFANLALLPELCAAFRDEKVIKRAEEASRILDLDRMPPEEVAVAFAIVGTIVGINLYSKYALHGSPQCGDLSVIRFALDDAICNSILKAIESSPMYVMQHDKEKVKQVQLLVRSILGEVNASNTHI